MAVNLSELLALPRAERLKLAETLMESAAPSDIESLLRALMECMERTNQALVVALDRMESLDSRIELDRAAVREAVRRSGESWPFPLPQ